MKHLLRCEKCRSYTLIKTCSCGGKAISPKPPKYSPEDNYGEYRRRVKKPGLKEEGLI